ncbi:hypothetical protein LUX57_43325 [Actinomadura madurae]|uniref:hypothetical protein n=1 Tax=Actinomadura madurae TaxID=1993 RepID=UPI0020D23604|nr:hypothetical protein [Actinomadura madurae]MCP9971134.1 hypothetical protein [Actinomadura madurae]
MRGPDPADSPDAADPAHAADSPVPPGGPTPPGPSPAPPSLPSSPLLPELPSGGGMGPGATAAGEITPPKELPFTGAGALPLVALGITAIAAGSAAVAATRRRHVRES